MNSKLYALIFWRTPLGEILNKIYDLKLHFKYAFKLRDNHKKEQLAAYIQKNFHVIEKGMALPEPRPGFGKEKILDIILNSEKYITNYGHDRLIDSVIATLIDYLEFNKSKAENLDSEYYKTIKKFTAKKEVSSKLGGTKTVYKQDILKAIDLDFDNFVKTRNSVRDFSSDNVPNELVQEALTIAKFAPSVCNRQGWKMHLYTNPSKIKFFSGE